MNAYQEKKLLTIKCVFYFYLKKNYFLVQSLTFPIPTSERLTPPYMLTLLIVLGFQQYLGSGALWSPVQPGDKENCENYWWANLLYINNLVDAEKMVNIKK